MPQDVVIGNTLFCYIVLNLTCGQLAERQEQKNNVFPEAQSSKYLRRIQSVVGKQIRNHCFQVYARLLRQSGRRALSGGLLP